MPSLLDLLTWDSSIAGEGGAINRTHIPIHAPDHQASLYINRKGYFSVVLQAVMDHQGQFTDIYIGWLGNAHSTCLFRNCSMFHKLHAGTFFSNCTIRVGDVDEPVCLVSSVTYPLQPWLMKPYTSHLNPARELYNAKLRRARMLVKGAFGLLKVHFRCLLTCLDLGEHSISHVVTVYCLRDRGRHS